MSKQKADSSDSKRAATTEELGADALERVTGGRGETIGIGKYPPAEPGALLIGPLEAAMGSLTRPRFVWPPEGGRVNATDSSDPDAYPLSPGS